VQGAQQLARIGQGQRPQVDPAAALLEAVEQVVSSWRRVPMSSSRSGRSSSSRFSSSSVAASAHCRSSMQRIAGSEPMACESTRLAAVRKRVRRLRTSAPISRQSVSPSASLISAIFF
jgi:hypothetical protein